MFYFPQKYILMIVSCCLTYFKVKIVNTLSGIYLWPAVSCRQDFQKKWGKSFFLVIKHYKSKALFPYHCLKATKDGLGLAVSQLCLKVIFQAIMRVCIYGKVVPNFLYFENS